MSQRLTLAFILMCTLALLAACGGSTTPAAPGDSATKLAQTAEAILTATAAPKVTPTATTPPIVPVTDTPQPPPLPPVVTTAAPCTNDSKFLEDITVPDGTHFAPGTSFDKTWRIQNTGTCTWDTTYQFRLINDVALAGQNMNLPQTVAPNATIDITVKFVSPMTAGKYRSQWRIFAPDGSPFGQRPYVDIVVP